MPERNDQISATRALLREICSLIDEHMNDAVLIGGWVPDLLFPNAVPRHVGSVDVDLATSLQRESYNQLELPNGRTYHSQLDLLTSRRHREEFFMDASPSEAPEPIPGAEMAFANNQLISLEGGGELRVAGIVAFLVMKSLAMHERDNGKDAYDIHFCLENYPDGLEPLAELFRPWRGDTLIEEALQKMELKFRSEEDEGPRVVATIEHAIGESRAIRKLQVATRVQEFLALVAALLSG